jgi:hypothetical protein
LCIGAFYAQTLSFKLIFLLAAIAPISRWSVQADLSIAASTAPPAGLSSPSKTEMNRAQAATDVRTHP